MKGDTWFLISMGLLLGFGVMLAGFAMGQQSVANECKRFGMFYNNPSSMTYACQRVGADDVVVTDFKEVGR